MKKTTISLLLSLLCVSFVYCQKNTMKWGAINKSVKGLYENDKSLYELLDMDKDHYYLSNSNYTSTKVKLLCFDNKTHQLVSKTALNLSYKRKKTKLHQFFETEKGKFTYQSFYKKKNMHFITSKWKNLKLEEAKEVFKYPYDNRPDYSVPFIYIGSDVSFNKKNVFVSPNKKYVGFVKNRSRSPEDKNEKIAICLFDSDMNKIWSRLEEVKHLDQKTILKDFVVDNNGIIYLLVLKLEEEQDEPFSIFKITGDKIEEIKIKLKNDLFIKSIKIKLNFNGNGLIICGAYSDNLCLEGVEGTYLIRDFSKDKMSITTAAFTNQIMERRAEQQGFYCTKSIEYFSDGSMCVLTEVETHKMDYYRGTKADNLDFDKVYLCTNDLIVTIISADNKVINTVHIKKNFFENQLLPDYLSYKAEMINDRLYIVYNAFKASEENAQSSKALQATAGKIETITHLTIINKRGKIESTKPIIQKLDAQKNKLILLPGFSFVKGNTFLFNSYNIGVNRFGFLEVE